MAATHGDIKIESTLENRLKQKTLVHYSSSTVFLVVHNKERGIETKVSLLNHFLLKRSIGRVQATVELRDLSGKLLDQYQFELTEPRVYSFNPIRSDVQSFIGSAYIFFVSEENLAVPFCAVMETVEAKHSICGVHTYGRVLEKNEIGSSLDLKKTAESGWTLRDADRIHSFAVLHNGSNAGNLDIALEVLNSRGEIKTARWRETVPAKASLLVKPGDRITDLVAFLDGREGHATLSIEGISGIFPRLLCGNFCGPDSDLLNASEIQFTHSNFDFSKIQQPPSISNKGYFNQPFQRKGYGQTYPYGDAAPAVSVSGRQLNSRLINKFEAGPATQLAAVGNPFLPSRVVSATVSEWGAHLPSECSTGVFTEDYLKVPCHWHWGLLVPNAGKELAAAITIFQNNFDRESGECKLNLRLFDETGLLSSRELNLNGDDACTVLHFDSWQQNCDRPRNGNVWYLFSGERLEHLNVFATTLPPDGMSGFIEHAF